MTSTPYTDEAPAIRDAGRRAARHKLDGVLPAHLAEHVAHEIADTVLEAVLPQIAADRVTIPGAEGYGEPVHWTVYNAMHQRALYAEYRATDPDAVRAAALREGADAIDAETMQAKAHGVLEPDAYRPCRDASAQLRTMACPTPETHNWGCGCPTDELPAHAEEERRAAAIPASAKEA